MPLPPEILKEMAERRLAAQLATERRIARLWLGAGALCLFWSLIGLLLVGWSMHTTDQLRGPVAFWGGLGLGNGGWLYTVVWAYRKALRQGWV